MITDNRIKYINCIDKLTPFDIVINYLPTKYNLQVTGECIRIWLTSVAY
ncbi:MAG: hypothetical protein WC516_05060 [Patescibacteria group bacterium]|jgi:hypothetical protein